MAHTICWTQGKKEVIATILKIDWKHLALGTSHICDLIIHEKRLIRAMQHHFQLYKLSIITATQG